MVPRETLAIRATSCTLVRWMPSCVKHSLAASRICSRRSNSSATSVSAIARSVDMSFLRVRCLYSQLFMLRDTRCRAPQARQSRSRHAAQDSPKKGGLGVEVLQVSFIALTTTTAWTSPTRHGGKHLQLLNNRTSDVPLLHGGKEWCCLVWKTDTRWSRAEPRGWEERSLRSWPVWAPMSRSSI